MPNISVIVPAYNSEKTIEKCLVAIKQSSCRDYELIVADCGSKDGTLAIAKRYADNVIELSGKPDRRQARLAAVKASRSEVIVNIDSDVIIKEDSLSKIARFMSAHQDVAALTGMLSKEHPDKGFFSQYKNLYMNYIFSKLPERVSFLYGSIYAIRRKDAEEAIPETEVADDTAIGQRLFSQGKEIALLKDLEVVHLKRYGLFSFFANDFRIPYDWAKIFVRYNGLAQIGRNRTGFAHSSVSQLASVALAALISVLLLVSFVYCRMAAIAAFLFLPWIILNYDFLLFLGRERGAAFLIIAIFVTFIDNMVMSLGILCGFFASLYENIRMAVKRREDGRR